MDNVFWWGLNLATIGFSGRIVPFLDDLEGEAAWRMESEGWRARGMDEETVQRLLRNRAGIRLDVQQTAAKRAGAALVGLNDSHYPDSLRTLADPPLALSVIGDVQALVQPSLAIVGSRQASGYGLDVSFAFARAAATSGIGVISGMARGIDAAAHVAALDSRGRTVAVLGCGVDVCYPPDEHVLRGRLVQHGTLLSEYAFGSSPRPYNFPYRNRLISGLAQVLLVVEGTLRSGSLHTVDWALQQGKEVFAVPGSIHQAGSALPHRLLESGASIATQPQDVLSRFPTSQLLPAKTAEALPVQEQAILDTLAEVGRTPEEVSDVSTLALPGVLCGLLSLEMKGLARRIRANRYVRRSP